MADYDLLYLGELMNSPDASVGQAVRSDLATEAGRDTDLPDGQLGRFDDLVHPHRG